MKSNSKGLDNSVILPGPSTAQSSLEAVAFCVPASGIDFGYCGVSLETQRKIMLENVVPRSVTGSTVRYSIETDSQNFIISHSNGTLQPGKKQEITISFKTDEAKVQVALILVKLADIATG
jgi:hypothetical protein